MFITLFFYFQVKYNAHIVSENGVEQDPQSHQLDETNNAFAFSKLLQQDRQRERKINKNTSNQHGKSKDTHAQSYKLSYYFL